VNTWNNEVLLGGSQASIDSHRRCVGVRV